MVQWNGSAPNARLLALGPLGRNVGEVLGVFGEVDVVPGRKIPMLPFLTKPPQFISSANITNLLRLEDIVRTLWSPVWPKNCLPLADAKTLARGKKVYEDNCVGCHRILGDPERKQEDRQITAVLKTLPEVGTDPTMAMNFATRTAKTGPLEGYPDIIELNKFGSEASAHLVVMASVNGVVLRTVVPPRWRAVECGRDHCESRDGSGSVQTGDCRGRHASLQGAPAERHLGDGAVSAQRLGARHFGIC